jgi:cytidylate kinase
MKVIALDGPSASGKSSTARAVAQALGWSHLDSGALYRGLTMVALEIASVRRGLIEEVAPLEVIEAAESRLLELRSDGVTFRIYLDGELKDDAIRVPDVTANVSWLSAIPEIREWVDHRMREMVKGGRAVVIDGRDIGSVVFPEAPLKVFLTATPEARASRRLSQRGEELDRDALRRESGMLAERDRKDSIRAVAPLRQPEDALLLDSTSLSFQEQVDWIVARAKERGLA